MTSEPQPLPKRMRRAYELGRLRLALSGALPALVYTALACTLGAETQALGLGLAMFGFAALGLHLGHPYARGVGIGLALAAIPFGVASYAQSAGHLCLDGACVAVCMPACTAAGVATGLLGSYCLVRVRGGLASLVSLATMTALGGALGCHCVGYGSVGGLLAGFALASIPAWPRLLVATRSNA